MPTSGGDQGTAGLVRAGHPGFPKRHEAVHTVRACLPVSRARTGIGVEGIDGVVLGGDEDDVMRATADGEIRHPKGCA